MTVTQKKQSENKLRPKKRGKKSAGEKRRRKEDITKSAEISHTRRDALDNAQKKVYYGDMQQVDVKASFLFGIYPLPGIHNCSGSVSLLQSVKTAYCRNSPI
jgi:hypothetical protein